VFQLVRYVKILSLLVRWISCRTEHWIFHFLHYPCITRNKVCDSEFSFMCRAKKALFNGFTSLSRKSLIYQYHARDLSRNAALSRNEHAFLRNNFCQPILQFVIVWGTLHNSPQKIFNLRLIQGISVIPSDGFMHCLRYIFHALPIPERFNQFILSLTKNWLVQLAFKSQLRNFIQQLKLSKLLSQGTRCTSSYFASIKTLQYASSSGEHATWQSCVIGLVDLQHCMVWSYLETHSQSSQN